jgi:predicted nucleic acid-binding protein
MLVICDNSTLSALAEIGLIELLPQMVGHVTIPAAIAREAAHPSAPAALREWISTPPAWLRVESDPDCLLEETKCLGPGEAAAITLAWQQRGSSGLIIDEKRGRALAKSLGLPVTGLLALLITAAHQALIDFEQALASLLATGFRLSPALVEQARLKAEKP